MISFLVGGCGSTGLDHTPVSLCCLENRKGACVHVSYIFMCVHVHVYLVLFTHTEIHIHTAGGCTHACTHIRIQTDTCARTHTQRHMCAHTRTHRLTLHPHNTDTTRFRLSETYNEGTRLTPQQHFMSFSLVQETQYQTVWVWLTYKALHPMVAYLAFHSLRRHVLMSSLVL